MKNAHYRLTHSIAKLIDQDNTAQELLDGDLEQLQATIKKMVSLNKRLKRQRDEARQEMFTAQSRNQLLLEMLTVKELEYNDTDHAYENERLNGTRFDGDTAVIPNVCGPREIVLEL